MPVNNPPNTTTANNLHHVRSQLLRAPPKPMEVPKVVNARRGFQLKRPDRPVRLSFQMIQQKLLSVAATSAASDRLPPPPPEIPHSSVPLRDVNLNAPPMLPTNDATAATASSFGSVAHPTQSQAVASTSYYTEYRQQGGELGASRLLGSRSTTQTQPQPFEFQPTASQQPQNNNNTTGHMDPFDNDEDDAFFASLDVDRVVAEASSAPPPNTTAFAPTNSFPPASESGIAPQTYLPPIAATTTTTSSHHQFPYDIGTDDNTSAPLCSGHNLPCILLTARSEQNSGRQFYKCRLPDQPCDFFEWADGGRGCHYPPTTTTSPNAGDVKDIMDACRYKFGHRSFRPGQQQVIQAAVVARRDVFCLMPTGGGKSLCYQCPAWCLPGLAVVISPLLSLMQDQVIAMQKLGVEAVSLSGEYGEEQADIVRRLQSVPAHGGIKLLYITPEKLSNSTMLQGILQRLHSSQRISLFVIGTYDGVVFAYSQKVVCFGGSVVSTHTDTLSFILSFSH